MEINRREFLGQLYNYSTEIALLSLGYGCSHIGGIGSGIKSVPPDSKSEMIAYSQLLNTDEIHPDLEQLRTKLMENAAPSSFEDAFKEIKKEFPELNENDWDALDGKINEREPTRLDTIMANATTEYSLPKNVYILRTEQQYPLDDFIDRLSRKDVINVLKRKAGGKKDGYKGGFVSFFLNPASMDYEYIINPRTTTLLPFDLVYYAANKGLMNLSKDKKYKSVHTYRLKQTGNTTIGRVDIYDMAGDKGLVIPNIVLHNDGYHFIPTYVPENALKGIKDPSYNLVDNNKIDKLMALLLTGAGAGINLGLGAAFGIVNLHTLNESGKVISYEHETKLKTKGLDSSHVLSEEDITSILNSPTDALKMVHPVLDNDEGLVGIAAYTIYTPRDNEGSVGIHSEGLLVKQNKKLWKAFADMLIRDGLLGALYGYGYSQGRQSIRTGRVIKSIRRGGHIGHTRSGGDIIRR